MSEEDSGGGWLSRIGRAASMWLDFGSRPPVSGASRADALQVPPSGASVARLDGGGGEHGRGVMDCGPGGCGGDPWGGGYWGDLGITPGLDRTTIDDLYTDSLMRKIVRQIVEDALKVRPTLSGRAVGELSGVVEWLEERGYWTEMERALVYSRLYGGGAIVCFIDDGRPPDQEVDLLACRSVIGYYALPKWYVMPSGSGSGRVSSAWYGQRVGRPEWYQVTPNTGFTDASTRAAGTVPEATMSERDVRRLIERGSGRFHRSRIIAWPHCSEIDLRLARWVASWAGWGPGVVEGCAAAFLARRKGALRLSAIMNSIVVNTLEISDIEHRQSTPDGGAALKRKLDLIKWCRDYTSDAVPLIATDPKHKFSSLTHQVAGIDRVIGEQRQFLLDTVPEYSSVVLFGDTAGGLNGGNREGEWRSYYGNVANYSATQVWTAGSFGGGMRQACLQAMACRRGPTDGQMDRSVKAEWPSQWVDSAESTASTRLKNSQARAQDALVLRLTPDALLRHDPTVRDAYPSLEVDDGPLPELDPSPSVPGSPGVEPATLPATATAPVVAGTPGATNEALAAQQGQAAAPETADAGAGTPPAPAAPLTLPDDLVTEIDARRALKCGTGTFRRWVEEGKVEAYKTGGGRRYSLRQVLAAARSDAAENLARADAALRMVVLP